MSHACGMHVALLTRIGESGDALKEDRGASIAEWAVHHVGVSCDPTNVSHTRKHLRLRMVVKGILGKGGGRGTGEGEREGWGRDGERGKGRGRDRERERWGEGGMGEGEGRRERREEKQVGGERRGEVSGKARRRGEWSYVPVV